MRKSTNTFYIHDTKPLTGKLKIGAIKMKSYFTFILTISLVVFLFGCRQDLPSTISTSTSSNSNATIDSSQTNSNINTHNNTTPNSAIAGGKENTSIDKSVDRLAIEKKYAEQERDYTAKIAECKTEIASIKIEKMRALADIDNQIQETKKEGDRAYSQAIANSGGYGSSYANTIKSSYAEQVWQLQQQRSSTESLYDDQISVQEDLIQTYTTALNSIPAAKEAELAQLMD